MGLFSWLIVVNAITSLVSGEQIPLLTLRAGDTLNVYTLNSTSADYFDSVFDSYNYGHMLTYSRDISLSHKITCKRELCASLDSLKPLLYPDIYRGKDKLDTSKSGCSDTENRGYFDDFENYLDESKHLFGLVKICRVMRTQSLYINLIESKDLPIVNGRLVHKIQKLPFGLLRFRRGDETHYVSSITTGNCLFQIYVNTIDACKTFSRENDMHNFFYSSVFKTKITRINEDYHFETDPEFSNSDKSLYSSMDTFTDLIKNHKSADNVLNLKLLPLQEEPKLLRSIYGQLNVKPGDVLTQHDFSRITTSLMRNSMGGGLSVSAPSTVFSYSNCFKYVAPAEPLINSKIGSSYYDYNLDLFEEMVAQNNYGVPDEYLTEDSKCYKVTVCSGLYELSAPQMPSIKVIDLDKFLGDNHEYNIMYDEHSVMRQSNETKLYYVSAMHFGNCLFQAQIFPPSTTFEDVRNHRQLPVYKGHIISAGHDQTIEKLVKEVISSYENSVNDSLFNLRGDFIDLSLPVHNLLTVKSLISLDLKQIA